ncbi:DJ-1/PfpI family protein, partial [Sodalis-like endosymbiont of Proechinophthirus fluctus]|uniref:DJ-1/PfpI family protein n=1 Tax=Sodalis-like endosymbiont of Proechinophthirus fluctus TaxID=1462730 RepID=UPI0016505DC8
VRLLADTLLADEPYDVMVLPSGMQGSEYFQHSPLLVECVQRTHLDGDLDEELVAEICAAPAFGVAAPSAVQLGENDWFSSA